MMTIITALLQSVDVSNKYCQVILLVSDIKEAEELKSIINNLGRFTSIKVSVVPNMQGRTPLNNVGQIIIGTPLFVQSTAFDHASIKVACLWNTHELLDLDLVDETMDVLQKFPFRTQILLASKLNPGILEFKRKYMSSPITVSIPESINFGISIKSYF